YTQRGEAALLSKQTRARMALLCGADAVFELPALFAVRSAEGFATGGVGVLAGLGVDVLSFGSECADIGALTALAQLRNHESAEFTEALRALLAQGMTYSRAWGQTAAEALHLPAELIAQPNVALGIEYLRAIAALPAPMEAIAIPRLGGYHSHELAASAFASASAIRAALFSPRRSAALDAVPQTVRPLLAAAKPLHEPDDMLLLTLRGMESTALAEMCEAGEGLERRVLAEARYAEGRRALIERVKCRRYTYARISRILAQAMLGINRALAQRHPTPEYARLIALRGDAAPLMKELARRATLPICADPVKLAESEVFQLECRATDLRALQCSDALERRAGQEFTAKFVRV
ncbi:MAG: nucleotidyltransferase family protein, partial [Clostridia bacterium]|nr:nucleotidyltransferase family protein [Clostridia bacterium]